jgi:class 3 adenylate cyclase
VDEQNRPVSDEMREERKVVTALFADLVGSTTIGERFDPEDAREIVSGGWRGSHDRSG